MRNVVRRAITSEEDLLSFYNMLVVFCIIGRGCLK